MKFTWSPTIGNPLAVLVTIAFTVAVLRPSARMLRGPTLTATEFGL
jgi:hypothetical protein